MVGTLRFSACSRIGENFRQTLMIDRFNEVIIKTRGARLIAIFVSPPAGLRNQRHVLELCLLAQLSRELIAIDPGKADINQRELGKELFHHANRPGGIIGDAHLVPHSFKQTFETEDLIFTVVYDHDAPRRGSSGHLYCRRSSAFDCPRKGGEGKGNHEFATVTKPVAFSVNSTSVKPDNVARKRKPDAEPVVAPFHNGFALNEHIKDLGHQLGSDSAP